MVEERCTLWRTAARLQLSKEESSHDDSFTWNPLNYVCLILPRENTIFPGYANWKVSLLARRRLLLRQPLISVLPVLQRLRVDDGTLSPRYVLEQEVITAWQEGIVRLIERGVTGRILLINLPTPKGLPVSDR